MIQLEAFLKNTDINSIEVFITNAVKSDPHTHMQVCDVSNSKILDSTLKCFGSGHEAVFTNYFFKNMCYVYDMANDGQRVVKRSFVKDNIYTYSSFNLVALGIKEDTLLSHRFPCGNDIAHKNKITRTSYRINNRMFLCREKEDGSQNDYVYIRYNHSPQVDLKKMQADLERVIRTYCK